MSPVTYKMFNKKALPFKITFIPLVINMVVFFCLPLISNAFYYGSQYNAGDATLTNITVANTTNYASSTVTYIKCPSGQTLEQIYLNAITTFASTQNIGWSINGLHVGTSTISTATDGDMRFGITGLNVQCLGDTYLPLRLRGHTSGTLTLKGTNIQNSRPQDFGDVGIFQSNNDNSRIINAMLGMTFSGNTASATSSSASTDLTNLEYSFGYLNSLILLFSLIVIMHLGVTLFFNLRKK